MNKVIALGLILSLNCTVFHAKNSAAQGFQKSERSQTLQQLARRYPRNYSRKIANTDQQQQDVFGYTPYNHKKKS